MKIENVLIVGGLVFIGYWLIKKPKRQPQSGENPQTPQDILDDYKEKPKTIVLDLSEKNPRETLSKEGFYGDFLSNRGYNTSKFSTVAPAQVTVKRGFL